MIASSRSHEADEKTIAEHVEESMNMPDPTVDRANDTIASPARQRDRQPEASTAGSDLPSAIRFRS